MTRLNLNINNETQKLATNVFANYGLTLEQGVAALISTIAGNDIDIKHKFNLDTFAAMKEAEKACHDSSYKAYDNIDEMWSDLMSEVVEENND